MWLRAEGGAVGGIWGDKPTEAVVNQVKDKQLKLVGEVTEASRRKRNDGPWEVRLDKLDKLPRGAGLETIGEGNGQPERRL